MIDLSALNALDADAAARVFLDCCGSSRWARLIAAARPFASAEAMSDAGDRIWRELDPSDWLEAFAAHPQIGADGAGAARGSDRAVWSAGEQAGVESASADVRRRLAAGNQAYKERFGYIFIVCATGRSAAEMLAMLEHRLGNEPEAELHIAAEEQRKITRLRLAKLLADARLPTP